MPNSKVVKSPFSLGVSVHYVQQILMHRIGNRSHPKMVIKSTKRIKQIRGNFQNRLLHMKEKYERC